jgi:hypothetical protein
MTWRGVDLRALTRGTGGVRGVGADAHLPEPPTDGGVTLRLAAVRALAVPVHGRAVQVDPMDPSLNATGSKRLKLNYV